MHTPWSRVAHLVLTATAVAALHQRLQAHESVPLTDGPDGITCQFHYAAVQAEWSRRGGDWLDADGVRHGGRPFASFPVPRAKGRQAIRIDVTEAVNIRPMGGRYIALMLRALPDAPEGAANFASREHSDEQARPLLAVTWIDGRTAELAPVADTSINCTTIRSLGDRDTISIGGNDSLVLVFHVGGAAEYPVESAVLSLTTDRQWGNGTAGGVFQLWPPTAEPALMQQGLAAAYPGDHGLEKHEAVLFTENFESTAWGSRWTTVGSASIARVVSAGEGNGFEPLSGNALRVSLHPRQNLGLDARFDFAKALGSEPERAYLRYYLRFGDDWAPTQDGGKLPGLAGTYNRGGWGGRKSDGYNGWSARGAFLRLTPEHSSMYGYAGIGSYVYHAGLEAPGSAQWGWGRGPTGRLARNRWYSVEQYVQMNDPGKANGILRAWIDGYLVFERTDLGFRNTPEIRIENAWFNVYHGGLAKPPSEMSVYLDNVVISTDYIGPLIEMR